MWNNEKRLLVQRMLYQDFKDTVLQTIKRTDDPEILHVFTYNYNWDDGFEIPNEILLNGHCELSTALLIFYNSGGFEYLHRIIDDTLVPKESFRFIESLYESIKFGKYTQGNIKFIPPLTKVQLYKLKKLLSEDEKVFITTINGVDMDLVV